MSSLREKERAFLAIREAIVAGAKAFLSAFKRDLAGEEMFGFLLVAEWDGSCVEAVAGTEEGLLRVVHEYGEHEGKFVDDEYIQAECIKFRWSGHEDGWYENFDPVFFSTANQLIFEAHKSDLMEGDQQLQQICIEALAELDADHVFGVGEAREAPLGGIDHDKGALHGGACLI